MTRPTTNLSCCQLTPNAPDFQDAKVPVVTEIFLESTALCGAIIVCQPFKGESFLPSRYLRKFGVNSTTLWEMTARPVAAAFALMLTYAISSLINPTRAVIGTNMIAQLVGGENVFTGIYASLVHLYDEEGIAGWFRWALPPSFFAPPFPPPTHIERGKRQEKEAPLPPVTAGHPDFIHAVVLI